MNEIIQLIILSLVQGITEFLPISSSAHLIILPEILSWDHQGIVFDVTMHFGSLMAITYYYFQNKDKFLNINTSQGYINFSKIFIGSAPVLFFGYFYHDYIIENLRSIEVIAITTILVAILLLILDLLKRNQRDLESVTYFDISIIGIFQAIALIPGVSRSAIIIFAALLLGYNRKSAIIITIILAFPVITIATIYEFFNISNVLMNLDVAIKVTTSLLISFFSSYLIINYLMIYIDRIGFYPFMIYRLILGFILISFFV